MGRPVDPKAQYQIKPHTTKGYTYASTQPSYIDQETGKKKYRYIHWGTVDENLKFNPGPTYRLASPDERDKLIFPDHWDLSEISMLSDKPNEQVQANDDHTYHNRLYGDVWLMEQVAIATNIRQDLEVVFKGNLELVEDIITLAIYPYLTQHTYNRVVKWQNYTKAPSSKILTPSYITKLTQSITEQHRMELLKLRAARLSSEEMCAVDSTTRSAYGNTLADIRWGKNKENIKLQQTTEVVVYSLTSHMPHYYRTFPGNMPDCVSLDVILHDLDNAGFKNLVLITDRGYETSTNLGKLIDIGQAFITCAKIGQPQISKLISEIPEFRVRPDNMAIDPDKKIYYSQHPMDYEINKTDESSEKVGGVKINLYFNPFSRCSEQLELDEAIAAQKATLEGLLLNKSVLNDSVKRDCCYFKLTLDKVTKTLKSFELNEKKVSKLETHAGFFSSISYGIDLDALETLHTYYLRDEQEKYFQIMKDQLVADRQRNWSEDGKTGRLFILFVSLILSSYVRNVWKTTKLHDIFSSTLDVIDEMKPIRCSEADNKKKITPFIGKQVDICEAFGFEIPIGCRNTKEVSSGQPKRKRGRPRKIKKESSL
jgi:transposase